MIVPSGVAEETLSKEWEIEWATNTFFQEDMANLLGNIFVNLVLGIIERQNYIPLCFSKDLSLNLQKEREWKKSNTGSSSLVLQKLYFSRLSLTHVARLKTLEQVFIL